MSGIPSRKAFRDELADAFEAEARALLDRLRKVSRIEVPELDAHARIVTAASQAVLAADALRLAGELGDGGAPPGGGS